VQTKVQGALSISFFGKGGKSAEGINGKFVFYQVLLDCLLRLEYDREDKKELMNIYKDEYKGNHYELDILDEYHRSYSPDKALWWYTRESFLYKTLNNALRTQNIHMIFLLRGFIADLNQQLKRYQEKKRVRVYRGQLMSTDELRPLKQMKGQLISINSFFSTSVDDQVAHSFLTNSDSSSDIQKVMFEIDADPRIVTSKPFADIQAHSESKHEAEVLFMLGSIFRIKSIQRNDKGVCVICMTLCNEDAHELKSVLMHMKEQMGSGGTNLHTLGKILQNMGEFKLAAQYLTKFVSKLSPNDSSLKSVYKDLSQITSQNGDFDASMQWQKKMLAIQDKPIHTSPGEYIE
jgi:tetratricopeptide (TPR) repeat protein